MPLRHNLCLTKHHIIKTNGVEVWFHAFLTLALDHSVTQTTKLNNESKVCTFHQCGRMCWL